MILEPQKIKSLTVSPSICLEVMRPDAIILVFWMLSIKPTFSVSSFTFIRRLFSSSSLSAIIVVSSSYLRSLIFFWQSWFQLVLHPTQSFSWSTLHVYVNLRYNTVNILSFNKERKKISSAFPSSMFSDIKWIAIIFLISKNFYISYIHAYFTHLFLTSFSSQ